MLAEVRRSLGKNGVQATLLHSFIFVSTVQVAKNAGLSTVYLRGLCGFGDF